MAENPTPNNDLPSPPPPTPDPRAGAEAALAQALEQRREAELKRVENTEVVDPDAHPQHYRDKPASRTDEPKPEKPRLVEGASTEPPAKESADEDKLLDRALALNIPLEDAQAVSRATLRRMVVQLEGRREQPVQREQTQTQEEEPEEFTLPPIESGDDSIEVLPGIKQGFDSRDKVILQQQKDIKELKEREQQRVYEQQVREAKNAEREFGRFIAADTDLHDDLGSSVGYPDDPAQMKGRGEMWVYYCAAKNSGKEAEEAFKVARRAVYGDKLADKEAKRTSDKAEAVAKRFTRPPAGGRPKEMPFGRERAEQEVAAWQNRQKS
jgi:hypothetical protein